jgi:hypothetical protein
MGWGETGSTWYCGHCLGSYTSPGWEVVMIVVQSVEWELVGEPEVLGEYLSQCHFVHHNSHLTWARTRASAVGSRRLTVWAMARPMYWISGHRKTRSNISTVLLGHQRSYAIAKKKHQMSVKFMTTKRNDFSAFPD